MASPHRGLASGPGAAAVAAGFDPILRNTLRYTISAREYAALHRYILSRSQALRRATPSPGSVEKALQRSALGGDYNAQASRHALRVFAATWLGMTGYDAVLRRLRAGGPSARGKKQPFCRSPALRLALSLSTILFLYRVLFRFLARLRAQLLGPRAEPFRRRNPRVSAALASPYAPALGASLAGLALGVCPPRQLRVTIAIYALFRALEFGWNMCELESRIWGTENGKPRGRPWWFGSWMLQPFVFGQLLHAVVFDRDCFPASYGNWIFKNSSSYLHPRPQTYPANRKWPRAYQVVDGLGEMARLHWPPFLSPILFPNQKKVLPPTLAVVSPLSSQAHPLIASLACATLHPADPSCLRTWLAFWPSSFPPMLRLFLVVHAAMAILPGLGKFYNFPLSTVRRIVASALRASVFATGSISTAWASICFFQQCLPRHVLATQRFFLGGFVAGLWAWAQRKHGRGLFLSGARLSVDSLWKVGVKRRWWKAMKGGDVCVFVLALMVTGAVYERDARALKEASWRKGVSWMRGEGFRDWAVDDDGDDNGEEHVEDTAAVAAGMLCVSNERGSSRRAAPSFGPPELER